MRTNTEHARYFGELACEAIRAGKVTLASGYAHLAGHWANVYLDNQEAVRMRPIVQARLQLIQEGRL